MRFIWEIMRKDRFRYLLGCFLGLVSLPVILFKSTIGGQLVDEVIVNQNYERMLPLIAVLLAAVLIRAVTKDVYKRQALY